MIFILGGMTLFVIFIVLIWENRSARTVFHQSALELHRSVGVVNTLVLLLSKYLVVAATWAHRRGDHARSARFIVAALGCALLFVAFKAVEYTQGIADGHTPATNLLFTSTTCSPESTCLTFWAPATPQWSRSRYRSHF